MGRGDNQRPGGSGVCFFSVFFQGSWEQELKHNAGDPAHVKHRRSEAFVLATGSDLFSELHLERTNVIRPRLFEG